MIAYASDQDGDNDIWVMNADGTGHRNLTTGSLTVGGRILGDGKEEQPAWSPDGTRIVYVSDRNGGDDDIWVMNADGTGHRNLHDNNDPESKPAWSPDGSRIVFVHNTGEEDDDDDIWTMDAQTGAEWELITTATADDVRFNAAAESNPAWSPTDKPPADDRQVKISWGNDATNRPDCPTDETCLNLRYEYIGTWDPAPYTLQCWTNNQRSWVGQWGGQPEHGCYYWGEPAHVVIDGIQSNTINWTAPPPPDDRQVTISWGSDASSRADCPTGETCLDLRYEFIGTWDPAPYTLQCWTGNNRSWVGQWLGQPEHGCYYWGEPAHVVIDGIRSNTINWTPPPPTQDPPALTAATSITAGYDHTCALRADGTAECWGDNEFGQATAPKRSFTAISAGWQHTCGLRADGTVECWGSDQHGQTTPPAGKFTALASGFSHTCGLRADGTVECWGSYRDGQTTAPAGRFTALASSVRIMCGLRADGTVECWGDLSFLWQDSGEESTFVPSSGVFLATTGTCGIRAAGTVECWVNHGPTPGGKFAALSTGAGHSCGLRADGTVECWGHGEAGQTTPPGGTFTATASGGQHSCGIRTDGTIECWGYDDGRTTPPEGTFATVTASRHSCALKTDGGIECWGHNADGEASPPAGMFTDIGTGYSFSCGLRTGGTIECWGIDTFRGETTAPSGTFTEIAVGHRHSCAIRSDRTLECWGLDTSGQATPPAGSFIAIAADSIHSCGIRTGGSVECWGETHDPIPRESFYALTGWCGLRTNGDVHCWRWVTTPLEGSFTALSSSVTETCGLRPDGTIECAGLNWDRKGTPPAGTFTAIAAGREHTCGVRTNGTVVCWGYDDGRATPPGGKFGPSKN